MKILLTGANGQLGNEMQLLAQENLQHTYVFTDIQQLDITNPQEVHAFVHEQQPDVIINCAAYTAVDKAEDNPELCDLLNHLAPGYLADAAEACSAAFIQISTDYVFDGTAHIPYKEDAPTCPNSVYGRTKLAGEQNALSRCKRTMIIRTAWLYSIFGNNFVKTMLRMGNERPQLNVVFDQIGTPTYAPDLARAIFTAVNQGIIPGIYHYSNEGVCSWYDFTLAIHRLAAIRTCKVLPVHTDEYPARAPRPHYSVLDKSKIKNTYHIEIPHWEKSLEQCIRKLQTPQA